MKRLILWLSLSLVGVGVAAQEIPLSEEQQLENLAETEGAETEDDGWWLEREDLRKDPVSINAADAAELRRLRWLTEMHISQLLRYRELIGPLLHVYELQAVPGWDAELIRQVLPYITIVYRLPVNEYFRQRLRGGHNQLLFRVSRVPEKARGFRIENGRRQYSGSPERILFRYRYAYKNLLHWGVLGDKDAGETFFRASNRQGFDFYSLHFFARKLGWVRALALGDYTVNLGQGLIQWQSLSFRKSAAVMSVKRQSQVLRPYQSAGEFQFHRGAGLTAGQGPFEVTLFASMRRWTANRRWDEVLREEVVSSWQISGLHRSASELEDRGQLNYRALGGNVRFHSATGHLGLQYLRHWFSLPVQKRDEPYNRYALAGKDWYNGSADYSLTRGNLHLFGEVALDPQGDVGIIQGLLMSLDPRVDISLLYRRIDAGYQSVNGNAFTEGSQPANESGLYTGLAFRVLPSFRVEAYTDFYRFPWLKYRVDAPSGGSDYLLLATYLPNKRIEWQSRFRLESKQGNEAGNISGVPGLFFNSRGSWRTQFSMRMPSGLLIRSRVEWLWLQTGEFNREEGFLHFLDLQYRPMARPFSLGGRIQYFDTESYQSRIYAFENDVLYSYSLPAFYDKGWRWYLNLQVENRSGFTVWIRWAQTFFQELKEIGSGWDRIGGNRKSEFKLQVRRTF